jgi:general secretion pathway protein J
MWRNSVIRFPPRERLRSRDRERGFTLIELLVALAIFALLTAFAYRGLNSMLEGREALQRETRKWRDVTLLVGRIERDVAAVLPGRVGINPSNTPVAPVTSVIDDGSARDGLSLIRSGVALQENALAAPQRVAYRKVDDRIERLTWASVDAAPRDSPVAVALLSGIGAFDLRFMTENGEWRNAWAPPGSTDRRLPAAIEVTVQLASGEKIVRLFDLPRNPAP